MCPQPCRPEVGPRCRWATFPPEALGETLHCLFHLLVAPGVYWLAATSLHLCLCLHSHSFLLYVSGSFLALMKIVVIEVRAQPNSECSHPEIFTYIHKDPNSK